MIGLSLKYISLGVINSASGKCSKWFDFATFCYVTNCPIYADNLQSVHIFFGAMNGETMTPTKTLQISLQCIHKYEDLNT